MVAFTAGNVPHDLLKEYHYLKLTIQFCQAMLRSESSMASVKYIVLCVLLSDLLCQASLKDVWVVIFFQSKLEEDFNHSKVPYETALH